MTQPTVDSDADLVAAIRDGDRRALETLYRRHAPWVVLRLSHRCADSGLVDGRPGELRRLDVVEPTKRFPWSGPEPG